MSQKKLYSTRKRASGLLITADQRDLGLGIARVSPLLSRSKVWSAANGLRLRQFDGHFGQIRRLCQLSLLGTIATIQRNLDSNIFEGRHEWLLTKLVTDLFYHRVTEALA